MSRPPICWAGNAERRQVMRQRIIGGLVLFLLVAGAGSCSDVAARTTEVKVSVVESGAQTVARFCAAVTGEPDAVACAVWLPKEKKCLVYVTQEDRHYSPLIYRHWGHELGHCARWAGGAE